MNTEKFCVVKIGDDLYNNWLLSFTGTMSECKAYASSKGFGGGVKVLKSKRNK